MFYYSRKPLKMSATNEHFPYHSMGGMFCQGKYKNDGIERENHHIPSQSVHCKYQNSVFDTILLWGAVLENSCYKGFGDFAISRHRAS